MAETQSCSTVYFLTEPELSFYIVTIKHHDLVPNSCEVFSEASPAVATRIDLRNRAELLV